MLLLSQLVFDPSICGWKFWFWANDLPFITILNGFRLYANNEQIAHFAHSRQSEHKLAPVWIQFQHETHSYSRNSSVACAIDQVWTCYSANSSFQNQPL
jgi:hypothetical protein